jgi:hypothetical protein
MRRIGAGAASGLDGIGLGLGGRVQRAGGRDEADALVGPVGYARRVGCDREVDRTYQMRSCQWRGSLRRAKKFSPLIES